MSLRLPPLSTVLAVLGYLGGIAGTAIGAYNVGNWPVFEQAIVTAIGGSVAIITHHHVTKKVVATSGRASS